MTDLLLFHYLFPTLFLSFHSVIGCKYIYIYIFVIRDGILVIGHVNAYEKIITC